MSSGPLNVWMENLNQELIARYNRVLREKQSLFYSGPEKHIRSFQNVPNSFKFAMISVKLEIALKCG